LENRPTCLALRTFGVAESRGAIDDVVQNRGGTELICTVVQPSAFQLLTSMLHLQGDVFGVAARRRANSGVLRAGRTALDERQTLSLLDAANRA
jgi:hypothetical protein